MKQKDYLVTYLNDHLAGSVAMIELAKRLLSNNRNTELGDFLSSLVGILEEKQSVLKGLIHRLGASESTAKKLAAWGAEKVGRFKLNNSLFSYSPLSRLEELETMLIGMESHIKLWEVLGAFWSDYADFSEVGFTQAAEDGRKLRSEVERYHMEAARIAFSR